MSRDFIGSTLFKGVIEELGWDRAFTLALNFVDRNRAMDLLEAYIEAMIKKQETLIGKGHLDTEEETRAEELSEDIIEAKRDEILADIETLKQKVIKLSDKELLLTKKEMQKTLKTLIELEPKLKGVVSD